MSEKLTTRLLFGWRHVAWLSNLDLRILERRLIFGVGVCRDWSNFSFNISRWPSVNSDIRLLIDNYLFKNWFRLLSRFIFDYFNNFLNWLVYLIKSQVGVNDRKSVLLYLGHFKWHLNFKVCSRLLWIRLLTWIVIFGLPAIFFGHVYIESFVLIHHRFIKPRLDIKVTKKLIRFRNRFC